MTQTALLLLLPVVAALTLCQRRRLIAVIGMGVFSLLLSAVYLLAAAPDVAVAEAAIGSALVTVIYVLAIRKTGRLVVVGCEVPGLLGREGKRVVGLEHDVLEGFARELGLDLYVQFVPRESIEPALLRGEADIAAGGLVKGDSAQELCTTPVHLPTAKFRIVMRKGAKPLAEFGGSRGYLSDIVEAVRHKQPLDVTLDLARFMTVSRQDLTGYEVERLPEESAYTFLVNPNRADLVSKLGAFLGKMQEKGELEAFIRRHMS